MSLEECLTDGKPDLGKINPLLVGMFAVSPVIMLWGMRLRNAEWPVRK